MNKQQLAAKIWESANRMRSKIEANEYKDYILGFIFYKYLSDKEEQWLLDRDYTYDDIRNMSMKKMRKRLPVPRAVLGILLLMRICFQHG